MIFVRKSMYIIHDKMPYTPASLPVKLTKRHTSEEVTSGAGAPRGSLGGRPGALDARRRGVGFFVPLLFQPTEEDSAFLLIEGQSYRPRLA